MFQGGERKKNEKKRHPNGFRTIPLRRVRESYGSASDGKQKKEEDENVGPTGLERTTTKTKLFLAEGAGLQDEICKMWGPLGICPGWTWKGVIEYQ